jgi:hypothetical protein
MQRKTHIKMKSAKSGFLHKNKRNGEKGIIQSRHTLFNYSAFFDLRYLDEPIKRAF